MGRFKTFRDFFRKMLLSRVCFRLLFKGCSFSEIKYHPFSRVKASAISKGHTSFNDPSDIPAEEIKLGIHSKSTNSKTFSDYIWYSLLDWAQHGKTNHSFYPNLVITLFTLRYMRPGRLHRPRQLLHRQRNQTSPIRSMVNPSHFRLGHWESSRTPRCNFSTGRYSSFEGWIYAGNVTRVNIWFGIWSLVFGVQKFNGESQANRDALRTRPETLYVTRSFSSQRFRSS